MYRYDEFDHDFVKARVAEFSDQVERRLAGEITEDQFRPLRLMNGVYLQLHAYMLRIAIPYGTLSSSQMRMLATSPAGYDKGYGHFTTRQNIQFNWPALSDIPAILADLASVEMHAIQTIGQLHPQRHRRSFRRCCRRRGRRSAPLCRDPAAVVVGASRVLVPAAQVQDRGDGRRARPRRHPDPRHRPAPEEERRGELGFAVYVGGGQGRTPMVAKKIRDFLPEEHLLSYTTAILRVYNLHGRRDNKYKARIKILVHETGTRIRPPGRGRVGGS
jgi:sulfite reductase (NADPH) hemoprotein beta-component